MKFYLAGPYSAMAELAAAAETIKQVSGWQCTSRWLTGQHDHDKPREAAQDDVADVREADTLVIDGHRTSTRGGMWVEFGVALERRMPIVIMDASPDSVTVFAYLPGVSWVNDPRSAGRELCLIEHKKPMMPGQCTSMTMRQYAAIMAMQGLLATGGCEMDADQVVDVAVEYADKVLEVERESS